jgi:hypothetical protein
MDLGSLVVGFPRVSFCVRYGPQTYFQSSLHQNPLVDQFVYMITGITTTDNDHKLYGL